MRTFPVLDALDRAAALGWSSGEQCLVALLAKYFHHQHGGQIAVDNPSTTK